ncbi:30S ribosomal protein S20 [Patescibacteria group bacterium]|nr:30S ribosomal protein S20 [Patescibacteria group bacterium]
MANIKSAKKRIKSSKKKASFNLYHISKVKKLIKQISKKLLEKKSTDEEKKKLYSLLQKSTDRAVSKKSITKAKAARIKSKVKRKLEV